MNYYIVEPEVAGQLGPKTTYLATFPTVVGEMEYLFDRWPCDEFVQAHPCFAVSDNLKKLIQNTGANGVKFSTCSVGITDYFEGKAAEIPNFWRLEPTGKARQDDFGLTDTHQLIVSEKVKKVLAEYPLDDCDIQPF